MSAAAARVVVSASSEDRAAPYVAALVAGGVPAEAIQVVEPAPDGAGSSGGVGGRGRAGAELLGEAAGLLLCGGADVAPWRYGEEPLAAAGLEVLPARDELEWDLLEAARARRVPVWGVCRGFQVLNVFLGGTLWQDLPLQRPSAVPHECASPPDLLSHEVRVLAPDAPLAERLAAAGGRPLVNSRHHQAVRRLAPGLLAVAAAPDGMVEAAVLTGGAQPTAVWTGGAQAPAVPGGAADPGAWWVRGVQWHPENLLELGEQLELWRDFAAAAAARARAEGR